jgi:hypothetical protein
MRVFLGGAGNEPPRLFRFLSIGDNMSPFFYLEIIMQTKIKPRISIKTTNECYVVRPVGGASLFNFVVVHVNAVRKHGWKGALENECAYIRGNQCMSTEAQDRSIARYTTIAAHMGIKLFVY